MARKFNVCTYRVLVEIKKTEEKSKGGIIIPDTARDVHDTAAEEGTLVSVGPQAFNAFGDGSLQAKPGDKVKFARYSGSAFEEDGTKYRLMNDEDILCVIIGD